MPSSQTLSVLEVHGREEQSLVLPGGKEMTSRSMNGLMNWMTRMEFGSLVAAWADTPKHH